MKNPYAVPGYLSNKPAHIGLGGGGEYTPISSSSLSGLATATGAASAAAAAAATVNQLKVQSPVSPESVPEKVSTTVGNNRIAPMRYIRLLVPRINIQVSLAIYRSEYCYYS